MTNEKYPQGEVSVYANVDETRRVLGISICNIRKFYGDSDNPYMEVIQPVVCFNGNRLFDLPKRVNFNY